MSFVPIVLAGLLAHQQVSLSADELCFSIAEQIRVADEPHRDLKYTYRVKLYSAAGVDPRTDSPDVVAAKMRLFWNAHQDELYCGNMSAMIGKATILKLAVDRSNSNFIDDVVRRWKLDLNLVDRFNGGTVLDFVDAELAKAQGTPRAAVLQRYQSLLARNGTKRSSEL